MLEIHAAELDQAERCPDWRRAARLERHVMIYQGGNRAVCWLGCLLERLGHRLQAAGAPRAFPLDNRAAQRT
jgi:hypothetical protein